MSQITSATEYRSVQRDTEAILGQGTTLPQAGFNVEIIPQSIGYLVRVGCQTFAIETKERLIEKLTAYLIDPKGTIEKYNQGKLFN